MKYKTSINNKQTKSYTVWKDMNVRCYQKRDIYETYKDCKVCEEWSDYQNFAKWFENNYIEGWCLDKDILKENNKLYSPETCCFVPKEINNLFKPFHKRKNNLPKGVFKIHKKYYVYIVKNGKSKYYGKYDNIEEATIIATNERMSHIKETVNNFKNKLSTELFNRINEIIK